MKTAPNMDATAPNGLTSMKTAPNMDANAEVNMEERII